MCTSWTGPPPPHQVLWRGPLWYAGVGWVIFRSKEYVPEEIIFHVSACLLICCLTPGLQFCPLEAQFGQMLVRPCVPHHCSLLGRGMWHEGTGRQILPWELEAITQLCLLASGRPAVCKGSQLNSSALLQAHNVAWLRGMLKQDILCDIETLVSPPLRPFGTPEGCVRPAGQLPGQ